MDLVEYALIMFVASAAGSAFGLWSTDRRARADIEREVLAIRGRVADIEIAMRSGASANRLKRWPLRGMTDAP